MTIYYINRLFINLNRFIVSRYEIKAKTGFAPHNNKQRNKMEKTTIGFTSLGCPKALVDSEEIITQLKMEGYEIVPDYKSADLVIINTCGFIESAVDESMTAIDEAMQENGKVIVTGCLGAKEEVIRNKFDKLIGITGPHAKEDVLSLVHQHLPRPHDPFVDLVPESGIKLTPKHYAYLKISEGCNNTCSFCIIPQMRGKLQSYPVVEVLEQARKLASGGVKELLVISQDTAAYGSEIKYQTSFYNGRPVKTKFLDLCQELAKLDVWVRLHYIYPYPHVDDVVPLMAQGKILPYLDIPFQHASPKVLKDMKRPGNVDKIIERIKSWRQICPDLVIRSTFIVGFPGESEEDFQMLLDFLTEAHLDRVGCFQYSDVDGAPANLLADPVSKEIKQQRYDRFMQHQLVISHNRLKGKIGQQLEVLIDEVDGKWIKARSKYDAPEIDGNVLIKNISRATAPVVGSKILVEIIDSNDYDLFAKII